MTKKEVELIRTNLNSLPCSGIESIRDLLLFADKIRAIDIFICNSQKPLIGNTCYEGGDLAESEGLLTAWLRNKTQRTLIITFNEAKKDIFRELTCLIEFGDINNIWEK